MHPNRTFLFLAFLLFSSSCFGQRILVGEVTEVFDGNTFLLTTARSTFKVQVQFIDPPRPSQPLYDVVKAHLSSLIKNKTATVRMNSFSQTISIGKVMVDGVDIGMQMLRDGAAWYSVPEAESQSIEDRTKYLEMEQLAKAEKRGVWSIPNIRPAWELRIENEKAEKERRDLELKSAAEKIARSGLPTSPALGMTYTEFLLVCGTHPSDHISVTETDSGRDTFVSLAETNERVAKMCFGSFGFTNGKLEYIRRSTF